jgi:hypothetical protein
MFNIGAISFRALRVYLAALESLAIREAADRSRRQGRNATRRFHASELAVRIGLEPETPVTRELSLLRKAGLLSFSETSVALADGPLPDGDWVTLLGGRGARRLVPVPRQLLRFLSTSTKPALVKTVLAYLLRGLSLGADGTMRGKGTAKISWICALCRISERAARSARAELIRMGWISKDTGSVQRKLNRDGAYFAINTAWRCATSFAPLARGIRRQFAPPTEKQETPSDLKNQKLADAVEAGFCGKKKPDLRKIRAEDIRKPSRLRELYEQAVLNGWLERSEAAWLNFAAAAVRANRVSGDCVRIFVGIVRKGLWHHISASDEDRARAVITTNSNPGCSREPKGRAERPESPGQVNASDPQPQVRALLEQVLCKSHPLASPVASRFDFRR